MPLKNEPASRKPVLTRPVGTGGLGAGAPRNCQTVASLLYNRVPNEKEYNGPPAPCF